jgi:seryl-tRNA synthetase
VQEAQASRNRIAKDIGQAKAKGLDVTELMRQGEKLKSLLEASEEQLGRLQEGFQDLLARIPNIPHESVPVGKSAADNPERRRWGAPRDFSFSPKDHVDVGEALGGLDFAAGTKIAGARFVLMKGEIARLHRAIAQFMLETHTREHGYTEIYTPYIINYATGYGTGNLPKFEQDLFIVQHGEGKHYLLPTAEVPVTNIVRDEILEAATLPLKFVCHSPCFRSEAATNRTCQSTDMPNPPLSEVMGASPLLAFPNFLNTV